MRKVASSARSLRRRAQRGCWNLIGRTRTRTHNEEEKEEDKEAEDRQTTNLQRVHALQRFGVPDAERFVATAANDL
jgi:hypothetical protein